jgi:hypothetical protein
VGAVPASDAGSAGASEREGWLRQLLPSVLSYLREHPVLCLLLLAPDVEYLTGSTPVSALLLNPPLFVIFLAQNIGFYGGGVLLIREAQVRWGKGWPTVLLLGAAYGILEEGIGVETLFNPATVNGAGLGAYGHWLGVNWANVAILVPIVHPLYSICMPILLLSLAVPATRGKRLLSDREIGIAFALFGLDVAITAILSSRLLFHFFAGPVLFAGAFVAVGVLVGAAWLAPRELPRLRRAFPSTTPARLAVAATVFPWAVFLFGGVLGALHAATVVVVAGIVGAGGVALLWVLRNLGTRDNELEKVALVAGLVGGLIPMGISSQIGTGPGVVVVVAADVGALLLLRRLWRRTRDVSRPAPGPPRPLGVGTVGS